MIKRKDLLFLAYLRKNARENLTTISRKTNIPVSTLFDRLKAQEGNLIKKHTTIIDFEKMGYNCRAKIVLKINKKDREESKNFLLRNSNVNSLYRINNGFDYMAEVVFGNVKELEEFLEAIDEKFSIEDKQIYYIIDEIERERFLSDPNEMKIGLSGIGEEIAVRE